MLRIIVTGKPREYRSVQPSEGSSVVGQFYLDERRFVGGKNVDIVWTCFVPEHKAKWAQKQVEKGYMIAVESSDMAFRIQKSGTIEWVEQLLMVMEISGL